MRLRSIVITVALVLGAPCALAASPAQVFSSVEFVEPNGNTVGQDLVISNVGSFWSAGQENGYPAIVCTSSTHTLKAVKLYSGYFLEYKLEDSIVEFTVKKYAVSVPPSSDHDQTTPCHSVLPTQRVLVNETYRVHVGATNQSIELPDGSIMKYSISV